MVASMRAIGLKTTCMDKAYTLGRMGASMMATTKWIRSMDSVSTSGLMGANTRACGRMASSMEKASIPQLMGRIDVVCGKMVNASNGSTKVLVNNRHRVVQAEGFLPSQRTTTTNEFNTLYISLLP
jgi:hypothetical protein